MVCKWVADLSPRILISSWYISACTAITRPKLQIPNLFMLQHNTKQHKDAVRLSRWEADYRCVKEAMITVHVHLRGRAFSSVAGAWHCQTSSLGCLTGARVWSFFFVNFIRDIGQDITPYDPTRCPLLTGMTLAFCLRATVDKYLLLPCGLLGQLSRGTEPLIADDDWINNWDHLHPWQYHREVIPWGDVHSYGCWDQFELDKYIFKRGFVIQPISEAGLLFLVLIVLKTWTFGWPIHVQNINLAFPPPPYAKRSKINLCEPTSRVLFITFE